MSALLSPLAALYGGALGARALLYRRGWLGIETAPVPVVSVGNLVAGGTGKTPVTALVARFLREAGLRPAIVSRGYLGKRAVDPLVVSDGSGASPAATAAAAGDEPAMLAGLLPSTPVVVARRRLEGARLAVSALGARSIVLDDGFQHVALRRDLDLVLVDSAAPFDNGRLLPAGLLREPPRALARAGAILVTGEGGDPESGIARWVRPGTPIFHVQVSPVSLRVARPDVKPEPLELSALVGARVVAFAGIARPERFAATLRSLGAELAEFHPFGDHHAFRARDVARLSEAASRHGARFLLTTEKDLARMMGSPHFHALARQRLAALHVEAALAPGEEPAFRALVVKGGTPA
ncbi:MAG TPA: tetraacyldisaccharide 4'-kinase [Verrucomicrobiae bacterium]|nr:tetraacyldisaccharide 4'-kinase [Verrucomicrobiae bacterium]